MTHAIDVELALFSACAADLAATKQQFAPILAANKNQVSVCNGNVKHWRSLEEVKRKSAVASAEWGVGIFNYPSQCVLHVTKITTSSWVPSEETYNSRLSWLLHGRSSVDRWRVQHLRRKDRTRQKKTELIDRDSERCFKSRSSVPCTVRCCITFGGVKKKGRQNHRRFRCCCCRCRWQLLSCDKCC